MESKPPLDDTALTLAAEQRAAYDAGLAEGVAQRRMAFRLSVGLDIACPPRVRSRRSILLGSTPLAQGVPTRLMRNVMGRVLWAQAQVEHGSKVRPDGTYTIQLPPHVSAELAFLQGPAYVVGR